MIKATAVIGANYGDEGKGLVTDFFASQDSNSIVVRFNGGAQAGHTVVTPEGKRHVFHHFGAGSFCEVPTYLSRFFIVNPLLWEMELKDLNALDVKPKMFLDYNSPVTTPYDMMLNQLIEKSRGSAAHGSVGVGIYETLKREASGFVLLVEDLFDETYVAIALDEIWNRHIPNRLKEEGIDLNEINNWDRAKMNKDFMIARSKMLNAHEIALDISEFQKQNIIFEGAQGLGLDAVFGTFPHVTPSRCGLYNILSVFETALCEIEKKIHLDVYYVSRTYLTRHGNGPLLSEDKNMAVRCDDMTNLPSKWQGVLRYAPLDSKNVRAMTDRIEQDRNSVIDTVALNKYTYLISTKMIFTHHDQVPVFPGLSEQYVPYISNGPTRNHIQSSSQVLV